jgi:hypothetical protein
VRSTFQPNQRTFLCLNGAGGVPVQTRPSTDMVFNGETGMVDFPRGMPRTVDGVPTEMHDSQHDIAGQAAAVASEIANLEARLNAHTFDPKTGEKVHAVTGRERDVLTNALTMKRATASYFETRSAAIKAQREAKEIAETASRNEELARAAFIRRGESGHEARAKALDDAMRNEEASAVAAAIVAGRRAQRA